MKLFVSRQENPKQSAYGQLAPRNHTMIVRAAKEKKKNPGLNLCSLALKRVSVGFKKEKKGRSVADCSASLSQVGGTFAEVTKSQSSSELYR